MTDDGGDRLTTDGRLTTDARWRARARKVIPGGLYGHQNVASLPGGYPQFMSSGLGAHVWDVDGNEYIDLMCSYGPVLLGHRHPRVDAAAARQAAEGDCQNGPSPRIVELAEAMTATVEHADWAIFSKNGTDATTQCVTIARAATGRRKILVATGAYHGALPWCTPGPSGVLPEDRAHLVEFRFNDLSSVEAAMDAAGDDVAGIVVSPIRHDVGVDLELPDPAFAAGLRSLCDRSGAVLILDDVRCGLRLHHGSSWEPIGVEPDLSAWSKAIANGYALGAVLGRDSLADAARSIFTTGSFWFAAVSMAASLATLEVLEEQDTVGRTVKIGTLLRQGLSEQASVRGIDVSLSGPVQMPFMTFAGDQDFALADVFARRAVLGGVYLHPRHNWFVSGAMDEADVDKVLQVTDTAFDDVAAAAS
ncbi:MAG TPA: aminotransferase class III-fold pyridoxal phosphate-dependent enzyme [Acidimicrobiales bacterium]|nr:aminotransferase class III-fold pyridoxal phosphate-dependent enzyme [Acidimicrobiales bacterium]